MHTHYAYTHMHTHALQMALKYRPRSWGKSNLILVDWNTRTDWEASCVLTGYYSYVQSRSPPAAPRDFSCFHGGTRRPIPGHSLSADAGQAATEIGSPDPSKSRRPSPRRAFTRHTRFQAVITVPEEANQTLRICSQFLAGQNIVDVDHWKLLLYCSSYVRPTRRTKRENRAHFGARYTLVCTLLAAARDTALGRCVLLLLYIDPAAAVVLRLLLRLLLLLLLQLLSGCDKQSRRFETRQLQNVRGLPAKFLRKKIKLN